MLSIFKISNDGNVTAAYIAAQDANEKKEARSLFVCVLYRNIWFRNVETKPVAYLGGRDGNGGHVPQASLKGGATIDLIQKS